MRRAGFLFAFEDEAEIDRRLCILQTEAHRARQACAMIGALSSPAERAYKRHSGSIVFAVSPVDIVSRLIAHDRFPRIAFPARGIDRLSVVMRVERDRALCARRDQIRDNNRWRVFMFQKLSR